MPRESFTTVPSCSRNPLGAKGFLSHSLQHEDLTNIPTDKKGASNTAFVAQGAKAGRCAIAEDKCNWKDCTSVICKNWD